MSSDVIRQIVFTRQPFQLKRWNIVILLLCSSLSPIHIMKSSSSTSSWLISNHYLQSCLQTHNSRWFIRLSPTGATKVLFLNSYCLESSCPSELVSPPWNIWNNGAPTSRSHRKKWLWWYVSKSHDIARSIYFGNTCKTIKQNIIVLKTETDSEWLHSLWKRVDETSL